MTALNYDKPAVATPVTTTAVGLGFTGGVGAVLLDVLQNGGSAVAIALIAGSTVIIAVGLLTIGLISQSAGKSAGSVKSAAGWFYGSPIMSDLPPNWDQQAITAVVQRNGTVEPFEVLAFRPRPSGESQMLLAGTAGPQWHDLDSLASLMIEIKPAPSAASERSITSASSGGSIMAAPLAD
jgi:hypothetical protein